MRKFTSSLRLFTVCSILFASCVILIIVVISCRKVTQQSDEVIKVDEVSVNFFTNHNSSDPVIAAAARFVKGQNEKYKFLSSLTKRIGFPYWDKSMVFSKPYIAKGSNADSVNVVYIPFAKDTEQKVNATLIIRMKPTDTTFRFLFDWQYAAYGFDTTANSEKWNARDVFHIFTSFDKVVFNTDQFWIKDKNLLSASEKESIKSLGLNIDSVRILGTLKRDGQKGKTVQKMLPIEICDTYTFCVQPCKKAFRESSTTILPGDCCEEYLDWEVCTTYYIDDGSGGGDIPPPPIDSGSGGGDGGSGGTGDPGSGWGDPCTGGGGVTQPKGEVVQPCGGGGSGWQPIPPDENLLPDEPIDTLLKKYASFVNVYRDSLAALCEAEHKERFFNLVNYNSRLDTFRVLVGASDDEVKPNYYMLGGRILYGSWHYHPKYSDGTPGYWPSGGDVAQLYDKPKGFVMIIDTYNARYALTVEDASKMSSWKNILGNGPAQLPFRLAQEVLSDSRAYSTGSDYVQLTKEKLLAALGTSANCGIGLYQASSANGTTFIKIN